MGGDMDGLGGLVACLLRLERESDKVKDER